MYSFKLTLSVAVLSWALCHTAPAAQAPGGPEAIESLVAKLESNASEDRQAFSELSSQRDTAIYALIRVALSDDDDPWQSRKTRAIGMLGEYRARVACKYLIQQFDFAELHIAGEPGALAAFPVAQSLMMIGEPGIITIIGYTPRWETEEQFRLAAYVLKKYYHREEEVGLFRLQWYLKRAEDPNSRCPFRPAHVPKLKRLVRMYESIELDNPKHWPDPRRRVEETEHQEPEGDEEAGIPGTEIPEEPSNDPAL